MAEPIRRWKHLGAFTRAQMEEILVVKLIATSVRQIGMFLVILAFPPGRIHHETAQALPDATQVFKLGPGPRALSPPDHPPAWWLVADGRIVAGDTGARSGLVERRLVEAGQWFDVVSGWTMADWTERAVCSTPVTLWALPRRRPDNLPATPAAPTAHSCVPRGSCRAGRPAWR